jgi:OHCU decarboxylase
MGEDPSMNRAYFRFLSVASAFALKSAGGCFKPSQDVEQMLKTAVCRSVRQMSTQAAGTKVGCPILRGSPCNSSSTTRKAARKKGSPKPWRPRKGTSAQKRALIVAHPDLAGKLGLAQGLTAESTQEQASAGLHRLTPDELAKLTSLNDAYRARFGIPFIMTVKGKSNDILAIFERRISNDADAETRTALAEIDRIAALRLKDILP